MLVNSVDYNSWILYERSTDEVYTYQIYMLHEKLRFIAIAASYISQTLFLRVTSRL